MATLFCQFLPGYLGRTAEHRGRDVEDEPLWSMLEIQEFLDEWLVAEFTDRRSSDICSELRRFADYMSVTLDRHSPSPWAQEIRETAAKRASIRRS
ncbi:hypothetical protein ABZY44_23435 [Streptomyces sp. NPDC006544]|uniref:hypothetical protein n=1 Tax=Streptomyces sp. NPDC006544 TaxID=3154583 RepID=UPI0033A2E86F